MKNSTIIGFILTPIVCIFTAQIASLRQEKADRDFQEYLENYKNSSDGESDSNAYVSGAEDTAHDNSSYKGTPPTKEEIMDINAKLPMLVADGTMFTKIEYDDKTMVQTCYYDFTQDVDESMITKDNISRLKENMVEYLKGTDCEEILKAGVVYRYVYRSVDKKKLYEIQISANDLI